MKNLKIINLFFVNSLQTQFTNLPIMLMFLFSKFLRYGMFFVFLYFLLTQAHTLGGYSQSQILFFYITFNLIDTSVQMLYREVYRFRPLVVSGGLDLVLAKPFSPLLRVLMGGPDFIDLGILLILVTTAVYMASFVLHPTLNNTILYFLFLVNSFMIATAFHITVLGLGVITLSVDHLIMVYRDLAGLMRLPVDVFSDFLRALFIFVIPIGVVFTFPAKALYGLLTWPWVVFSLVMGLLSLYLSHRLWTYSLTRYQSASS